MSSDSLINSRKLSKDILHYLDIVELMDLLCHEWRYHLQTEPYLLEELSTVRTLSKTKRIVFVTFVSESI